MTRLYISASADFDVLLRTVYSFHRIKKGVVHCIDLQSAVERDLLGVPSIPAPIREGAPASPWCPSAPRRGRFTAVINYFWRLTPAVPVEQVMQRFLQKLKYFNKSLNVEIPVEVVVAPVEQQTVNQPRLFRTPVPAIPTASRITFAQTNTEEEDAEPSRTAGREYSQTRTTFSLCTPISRSTKARAQSLLGGRRCAPSRTECRLVAPRRCIFTV
ncbi:hypothetical protein EVAR_77782_1 [Eumeta japonica]|uniref:Uncharacterized protein n=1 Tax=Eumeta variegata TaxID=151549 RepID=A0A4C1TAY1_EUMVA|nr:hypothetical protein EVAR_77782_1 [Eumeta japonica]